MLLHTIKDYINAILLIIRYYHTVSKTKCINFLLTPVSQHIWSVRWHGLALNSKPWTLNPRKKKKNLLASSLDHISTTGTVSLACKIWGGQKALAYWFQRTSYVSRCGPPGPRFGQTDFFMTPALVHVSMITACMHNVPIYQLNYAWASLKLILIIFAAAFAVREWRWRISYVYLCQCTSLVYRVSTVRTHGQFSESKPHDACI